MKGLLIKDFKLLKGQKNFFMTITAISIIMIIVSPGTSFPIGFLGFVGALFSLSSIAMMNLIMEMLFIFFTDNTKRLCTGKIYFWIDFRNNVFVVGNCY